MSNASEAATRALIDVLNRVQALHAQRPADPARAAALQRLSHWQARRLRMTYADLAASPRYAAAIRFFEDDLYGPTDYSQRDADLARVVPVMSKMLPASVITTVADAMQLNVLSHELDHAMLPYLPRVDEPLTVAAYCEAYRRAGRRPERHRQIELIGIVGRALDGYVKRPMVRTALAVMGKPARMAGLGALQDFLERGMAAFSAMRGAGEFLAIIDQRETQLMEAILAEANAPMGDPLATGK